MTGPDLHGQTLTDAIGRLEQLGFTNDFRAAPDTQVTCLRCGRESHADDLPMLAFERIEGASDPADENLVAGIECPHCHARGTVILPYGARASRVSADVLAHMHRPDALDH